MQHSNHTPSGNEEQVLIALRRIIRAIDLHSRLLVQKHGLTGPQLVVMRMIAASGNISAGELAQRISLSKGTLTGILDRLEDRGLVRRQRGNTDRRQVILEITQPGAIMLGSAPSPLQEQFTSKFKALAQWEQTQILSSLQRVVDMMEARDLDAGAVLATGPIIESSEAPGNPGDPEDLGGPRAPAETSP